MIHSLIASSRHLIRDCKGNPLLPAPFFVVLCHPCPPRAFFSDRLRADQATVGDARRLFYLCRDQLKIMRASFRDLDSERLIEDEKLRYHGAGLLRTKWWGAEHAYFSSNGKVRCGHFLTDPLQKDALSLPNTMPTCTAWLICCPLALQMGSFIWNC